NGTWCQLFKERFLVLPDDVFAFLAETGTEVQAHVRIDPDYKRVARGALWYEESLPAESILSGVVTCAGPYGKSGASRSDVLRLLSDDRTVQMGAKATTGKGQLRLLFREGGSQ
ncbi:MAG: RAMP superfamily CRISPR-associated protein, partial [Planctomycetaceae bacterium]